jgi:hypothetical protein
MNPRAQEKQMSSAVDLRRAWRVALAAVLGAVALAAWLTAGDAHARGPVAGASSYLGTRIAIGDAPWVGTIALLDERFRPTRYHGVWNSGCSAVVIGARQVLTATHCVNSHDMGRRGVRVGSDDLSANGGRLVRIAHVWSPQFLRSGRLRFGMDLALIETSDDLGVPALPLASRRPQEGEQLSSFGFGGDKQVDDSTGSPFLRRMDLTLDPTCGGGALNDPQAICAVAPNGGALRGGDSGGPLVVVRNGVPELAGIASAATQATAAQQTNVFGNVVEQRSFIASPPATTLVPIVVRATRITGRVRSGGRVRCEIVLEPKPQILGYQWYVGFPYGKPLHIPGVHGRAYGPRAPDGRRQTFTIPRNAAGKRLECKPIVKTKGSFFMGEIAKVIPHIPRR